MTLFIFPFLLFLISLFAGGLGALTGLGGGIIITPVLVLLFHVPMHIAMGAALMSVIGTSSGAAIAYVRKGLVNIRIGLFLESAAALGALIGAAIMVIMPVNALALCLGVFLLFASYTTSRKHTETKTHLASHPWAQKLQLEGQHESAHYSVQRVPLGWFLMLIAGIFSGLLGIGSGTLKVMAMDQAMALPYKVSTATSNFMIGITATVSAGIYFSHGFIDPHIVFPVVMGVFVGALIGARLMSRIEVRHLRYLFSAMVLLIALQMIFKGASGEF